MTNGTNPTNSTPAEPKLSCGHSEFDTRTDCITCLQFAVQCLNKTVYQLRVDSTISECGQPSRDATILRNTEPDIIYYGPHKCDGCERIICKVSAEQGGMKFDYPEGPIYPNTNWTEHYCDAAPSPAVPAQQRGCGHNYPLLNAECPQCAQEITDGSAGAAPAVAPTPRPGYDRDKVKALEREIEMDSDTRFEGWRLAGTAETPTGQRTTKQGGKRMHF